MLVARDVDERRTVVDLKQHVGRLRARHVEGGAAAAGRALHAQAVAVDALRDRLAVDTGLKLRMMAVYLTMSTIESVVYHIATSKT